MTVYYNNRINVLRNSFRWKGTMFPVVLSQMPFWLYLSFHFVLVVTHSTPQNIEIGICLPDGEGHCWQYEIGLNLSSVNVINILMVFLVVFYNGQCYARYMYMYDNCMAIDIQVQTFIQELTVSFDSHELLLYRLRAAKLVGAAAFGTFLSMAGGVITDVEYGHILAKGLLNRDEIEFLKGFNGDPIVLISSWALQIVKSACYHPCFDGTPPAFRAQMNNRCVVAVRIIMQKCRELQDLSAMPIPFPYFHTLDLVLSLNFMLLAVALVELDSLFTIIPFSIVLFLFLGLREVSVGLQDPFGTDLNDFPLGAFLNSVFDRLISQLDATDSSLGQEAYNPLESLHQTNGFTVDELAHTSTSAVLYGAYDENSIAMPFAWCDNDAFLGFQCRSKNDALPVKTGRAIRLAMDNFVISEGGTTNKTLRSGMTTTTLEKSSKGNGNGIPLASPEPAPIEELKDCVCEDLMPCVQDLGKMVVGLQSAVLELRQSVQISAAADVNGRGGVFWPSRT